MSSIKSKDSEAVKYGKRERERKGEMFLEYKELAIDFNLQPEPHNNDNTS